MIPRKFAVVVAIIAIGARPGWALSMLRRLETQFAEARRLGHLVYYESDDIQDVDCEGHRFELKFCPALARRFQVEAGSNGTSPAVANSTSSPTGNTRFNPFLPPDPGCFIQCIEPQHNLLFNKYSLTPLHMLLTTQEYASQDEPLERSDFEAAFNTLQLLQAEAEREDWLFFYNNGPMSGASQPHRHLQLIPTIGTGVPLVHTLDTFAASFPCQFRRFEAGDSVDGAGIVDRWYQAYDRMLTALQYEKAVSSMNVLFTSRWMLLVKRSRASLRDRPEWKPNSLIFAGFLLAKSDEEIELIRSVGPMQIVRELTMP